MTQTLTKREQRKLFMEWVRSDPVVYRRFKISAALVGVLAFTLLIAAILIILLLVTMVRQALA